MFDTYTEANYKNLIKILKNLIDFYIKAILNLTSSSDNSDNSNNVEIVQITQGFRDGDPDYKPVNIVKKKTILEENKTLFLTSLVQFNVLNQLSQYINDNASTLTNQLTVENFNKSLSYLKTTMSESFNYNNADENIQSNDNTITIMFEVF